MPARVAELDEVTFDLEADGEEVRRTVERRVFETRGWATVAVAFQERRPPADWGAPKLALVRLRRARGGWTVVTRLTLPAADAAQLAEALDEWRVMFADLAGGGAPDGDDDDDDDDGGDDGDDDGIDA